MRDDYWTLSFPRLTQDTSDDSYPDSPKDDTMTTDQPAWATDPRGLPPVVVNLTGVLFGSNDDGTYGEFYLTPSRLEDRYGPCTPLWPDTPPTPIDPADIKSGMRVRRVWERNGVTLTAEGLVRDADSKYVYFNGYYYSYLADGCEWFLIEDAPDDDAHWIRAIAEATPETAATVYAAIKGEQA